MPEKRKRTTTCAFMIKLSKNPNNNWQNIESHHSFIVQKLFPSINLTQCSIISVIVLLIDIRSMIYGCSNHDKCQTNSLSFQTHIYNPIPNYRSDKRAEMMMHSLGTIMHWRWPKSIVGCSSSRTLIDHFTLSTFLWWFQRERGIAA